MYQGVSYPPLVDVGPTPITISGVSYTVTGRAAGVSGNSWGFSLNVASFSNPYTYNGPIGTITGLPSGSGGNGGTSGSQAAYSNNSLQQNGTINVSLTGGNYTAPVGIRSALGYWRSVGGPVFQYQFDPIIPKDSTKTLVLNLSYSWARRP